jgi:hypothetical protein
MAINGGAFTQDFRTQLRKYSDGTTRVGEEGRLWYNNSDQTLRVSDGSTQGGVVLNSGITLQEEGSSISTNATAINFVGSGITVTGSGATKTITVDGSAITVQDEGSSLSTAATTLNFVGSGIAASGTGTTKTITVGGADFSAVGEHLLPTANITYDLGSTSRRWRDLYLSGNTIDLAGSTISSDGTGTISISADGVNLPAGSKSGGNAMAITSTSGGVNQAIVLVDFFSAAGGLSTANATFEFNGTVENKPVFIGTKTFTLENGSAFSNAEPTLFQF